METQQQDPNEGQDESTNIEHVEGDVNVEKPPTQEDQSSDDQSADE